MVSSWTLDSTDDNSKIENRGRRALTILVGLEYYFLRHLVIRRLVCRKEGGTGVMVRGLARQMMMDGGAVRWVNGWD